MITHEEFRIRQLILEEYRSGTNVRQALINVNAKINPIVISKLKADYWYRRFKSGDTCLFDKTSQKYGIIGVIQQILNGKIVRNVEKTI
jgi:hypothetical protein